MSDSLYCSRCNTPTQCRICVMGTERIVHCICKCEQTRLQREKALEAEQGAVAVCSLPESKWDSGAAFVGVVEDNKNIQMALRYVERWMQVKEKNLGLLLWGDMGTGESFVTAFIANLLLGADELDECVSADTDCI